jgi:hypothetical protein
LCTDQEKGTKLTIDVHSSKGGDQKCNQGNFWFRHFNLRLGIYLGGILLYNGFGIEYLKNDSANLSVGPAKTTSKAALTKLLLKFLEHATDASLETTGLLLELLLAVVLFSRLPLGWSVHLLVDTILLPRRPGSLLSIGIAVL